MSAQFGRWSFDGEPADPSYLAKVRANLAPYGPEGQHLYSDDGTEILYFHFHTTKESRHETQPHVSASGAVFTWDGRLDNRTELIRDLAQASVGCNSDAAIVAEAYAKWGVACFARLLGDWALAVWDPREHALLLAKDFLGTRHLYYWLDVNQITWSTVLDPLVLFAPKSFEFCEEYLAGWLSSSPAAHLTPYVGIHSVPPASFVCLTSNKTTIQKYWDFNPDKKIRYGTDRGYEEHFRTVFFAAVRRRLRSDSPILAELSGGMDSSSIVCVADDLLAMHRAETPRLDTVSYYNDSEPTWNEKPYFTKIEERRGRTGYHIEVEPGNYFNFDLHDDRFAAIPASVYCPHPAATQFAAHMRSGGYRVVLSGIGGDETTGGVPTPIPELGDLLATGRLILLAHQLKTWALDKRTPWFHLLFETIRGILPVSVAGVPKRRRHATWLDSSFEKRNCNAIRGYQARYTLSGPLPSFQENLSTLDSLRRQLISSPSQCVPLYETRFPFLDRDLLEFLYAVPRDQLVRPGQRRSLMRRALAGIVPRELLDRKRKAFVARGPAIALVSHWSNLTTLQQDMLSISLGIVNPQRLTDAMENARLGHDIHLAAIARIFALETWLRQIVKRTATPALNHDWNNLTEGHSLAAHTTEVGIS